MKQIKNILRILSLSIVITFSSCTEDFLSEIKPETAQDVYSLRYFIDDLDVLVNGAYGGFFSPTGFSSFQVSMEFNSDFYFAFPAERAGWINGREGNAYTHSYAGKDYDLQAQTMQWNMFAINMANTAIESLDNGWVDKDPKKITDGNRVMGEAKFIRAYAHWQIGLMLGAQYHSTTLNSVSGIYRTKPILGLSDIPKGRSTVKEFYDLVIADLTDAQSKLPETFDGTKHPTRYLAGVRKDAVTALLAKVYFQMNDFDKALAEVEKLLGPVSINGSTKYPLKTDINFLNQLSGVQNYGPDQGNEVIYGAEGSSAQRWTDHNKWVYYRFTRPKTQQSAFERVVLGEPFINLFDQAKDLRFSNLTELYKGYRWQKKLSTVRMNMPIFRAPEFHLMRAEILARKDQFANAVIELNHSRVRAGLDAYVFTTKEALIQEIIDERGRETLGESVRHLDNLRLGALEGRLVPLGQRIAEDKVYVGGVDALPWNSPFFIYDMPTNEIEYNPALR